MFYVLWMCHSHRWTLSGAKCRRIPSKVSFIYVTVLLSTPSKKRDKRTWRRFWKSVRCRFIAQFDASVIATNRRRYVACHEWTCILLLLTVYIVSIGPVNRFDTYVRMIRRQVRYWLSVVCNRISNDRESNFPYFQSHINHISSRNLPHHTINVVY